MKPKIVKVRNCCCYFIVVNFELVVDLLLKYKNCKTNRQTKICITIN